MILQIYMHWFWITNYVSLSKGVLSIFITFQFLTLHFGAGFPNVNTPSHLDLVNSTYQQRDTLSSQDSTFLRQAGDVIIDRSDDVPDTFNGNTDLFNAYPVKKYSKYSDKKLKNDDKYLKTKNVEILKEKYINEHFNENSTVFPSVETTVVVLDNVTEIQNFTNDNPVHRLIDDVEEEEEEEEEQADEPVNGKSENATTKESNQTEDHVFNVNTENDPVATLEPSLNKIVAEAAESKERIQTDGLDAGSITGITLGIVVVFSLLGATSFVLYRRRYLNKPQALNDKSSNLDSSGYIDDTSLRDNSEEMYSLDNDSFLNSLEAMTIQNYWTENVKHTKL